MSRGLGDVYKRHLKKRGLTTQAARYVNMAYMDPVTGEPVPREGQIRKRVRPKRDKPSAQDGEE